MNRMTDYAIRFGFAIAAIAWTLVSLQWYAGA